jgi:Tn3 transposase DDE domain
LRRRRIIVPAVTTLERLCAAAVTHGDRAIAERLAGDLTREQVRRLEALREPRPDGRLSWLGWLRRPAGTASAASYKGIVARLDHLRAIGIEPERARRIPSHRLARLAAEGERLSLGHLQDLSAPRRRTILVATVLELAPRLTDDAFDLHDKLVGRMFRRAERRQAEALTLDRRLIGRTMRALAAAGRALIDARAAETSLDDAIAAAVGWDRLAAAVEDARRLAARHGRDLAGQLEEGHHPVRQCLPLLLATFELRGVPAVQPLLAAIEHLRQEARAGRRGPRADAPTGFVPERWRPFVLRDGGVDRRNYELCAVAELRGALRSGDVWVEGSRRYRSVDDELLPVGEIEAPRFAGCRLDATPDGYLGAAAARLERALSETERLAAAGLLPDAAIRQGRLVVTPLRADTPDEAFHLHELLYGLLPRVRSTELLEEVDRWTGFSRDFTHLRTGLPAADRASLLTVVLADGINLGLRRMAEACQGVSVWQLARVVDWHVREDTYALATARLVEAQRQSPLARLWGDGTRSSSDGQFFQAGGFGEAAATADARYGQEPGVSFYSHISDQFGAFHTKVIAAAAHEAPHVLDGLLRHRTSLRIEEHHTDTGGFTDHVFGLCALLGFRFAPRIRDLPDKRLLVPGDRAPWPTLGPLIARKVRPELSRPPGPSSGGSSRRPRPAARRPRTSSRSSRPSRGRAGSPPGCARSATSSARSSSSIGCAAPSFVAACRAA